MAELLDVLVIGAGITGAGVAYSLRESGRTVFVVDAAPGPGTGNTSRNSGVIHAGLYYPPGSLKTQFCRRGAQLLYTFCEEHDIPYRRTGKYIVANGPVEVSHLERLRRNAAGVTLYETEHIPDGVRADKALFSPNTGIVDNHAFLDGLLTMSEAEILFHQKVEQIRLEEKTVYLEINGEPFRARTVINCAGLAATRFCKGYRTWLARGVYFRLKIPDGLAPPHLVYPTVPPESPALGIHLTTNIHGESYLGPDLEWIDREYYGVDPNRMDAFFRAASAYLPWLTPDRLSPGYAGIRPKLSKTHWSDFVINREGGSGQLIHCLGIESPGLTAAMAVGEYVAEWVKA